MIRGSIGGANVGNVGGPVFAVVDGMAFWIKGKLYGKPFPLIWGPPNPKLWA